MQLQINWYVAVLNIELYLVDTACSLAPAQATEASWPNQPINGPLTTPLPPMQVEPNAAEPPSTVIVATNGSASMPDSVATLEQGTAAVPASAPGSSAGTSQHNGVGELPASSLPGPPSLAAMPIVSEKADASAAAKASGQAEGGKAKRSSRWAEGGGADQSSSAAGEEQKPM